MVSVPAKQLSIVIAGHVDHGKSTLIGRLLHDTGSLPDGKYEELEKICKRRGTDVLEWSFVLDAFQAERDQAVTIDTTQIRFATQQRGYVIIDAPGHREFLKNMISGAASANAALLVVDASEGVREQTKRHAYMLSLLGIKQMAVVINKMDAVSYRQSAYDDVAKQAKDYLESLGLAPTHIIPISARHGDMMAHRGNAMGWYQGKTLVEALDHFETENSLAMMPLRFPVQDVYRVAERRIIVGRVESGSLKKGDRLLFSPTNEEAVVESLDIWPADPKKTEAHSGEVVGITLDDRLFVERGHVASHRDHPPMLSNVFRVKIFWLSSQDLKVGNSYQARFGTLQAAVTVQAITKTVDTNDLSHHENAPFVKKNSVAEITLRAHDVLPIDPYHVNARLGRLVLYSGYDIVGGGVIHMEGYPDQRIQSAPKSQHIFKVDHLLSRAARADNMGHAGGVFWFTGLSGAGKSTIAMGVEKRLFEKGYKTYVLDGDNVRHGLNADLGFSPEDRTENIRRIGEVAALMADAGLVVVTAFISPYQSDRDRARKAAAGSFHEIFVKADLATCEQRDPKGLYKKARAGKISEFTGIDSPYEAPLNPEIIVDTQSNSADTCIQQVVDYITGHVPLKVEGKVQKRAKH